MCNKLVNIGLTNAITNIFLLNFRTNAVKGIMSEFLKFSESHVCEFREDCLA